MERKTSSKKIHPVSIAAAIIFAAAILVLIYLIFKVTEEKSPVVSSTPVYNFTLIPAPTHTATVFIPTPEASPTSLPSVVLPEGTLGIGAFVKVSQTGGLGLRIREQAGISFETRFIAMDEEVFEVIGGPEVKDGYTWWQLEAPFDASRSGWAAESFLELIELSTPEP